jgi:predicted nucleic-acid-binding protein
MIGVDTNVLVRFLASDDPAQNEKARRFFGSRSAEDPAFVSAVTLAETVWVLHRRLKFPLADVIAVVRDLLASDGLIIEHAAELGQLLHEQGALRSDIADYLISWAAAHAGCSHTVTFDRLAAKAVPSMELLS